LGVVEEEEEEEEEVLVGLVDIGTGESIPSPLHPVALVL
jgi:hypothetical protein